LLKKNFWLILFITNWFEIFQDHQILKLSPILKLLVHHVFRLVNHFHQSHLNHIHDWCKSNLKHFMDWILRSSCLQQFYLLHVMHFKILIRFPFPIVIFSDCCMSFGPFECRHEFWNIPNNLTSLQWILDLPVKTYWKRPIQFNDRDRRSLIFSSAQRTLC
jgi:hypothetical protein